MTPEEQRLMHIFFPYASEKHRDMGVRNGRFVHYTSASVAVSIVKNNEVWMRNANTMNDFMEMEHGHQCILHAYKSSAGSKFRDVLNRIYPGLVPNIENLFDGWAMPLKTGTYLTCISEHLDEEDSFGRLSMWRAYGGDTGVAIVLNNGPFLSESDALKAYTSPVAYLTPLEFQAQFQRIADKIEENAPFLSSIGQERVNGYIFNMLRFAMMCTKHPGFREEKEWRIIYTPAFQSSDHVIRDLQTVRGTPQTIYKLPLKDIPQEGLTGVEIPQFLERIIIGPSQYPGTMYEAFVNLLVEAGVPNAAQKVHVSRIPLRQ